MWTQEEKQEQKKFLKGTSLCDHFDVHPLELHQNFQKIKGI